MSFADKIVTLRRKKGWSQEQLALMLGVSRQSVSKWEAGISMPEISKILQLSELFLVSTDYLLKDTEEDPYMDTLFTGNLNELNETQMRILDKLEKIEETKKEYEEIKEYEYISDRTLFGLPLIHIHFKWIKGYRSPYFFGLQLPGAYADFNTKAKGILAIGNHASGLLGIGFVAKGLISVGLFSIGLFALGIMSLGLLALGIVVLGGVAAGVTAIGYIAIGISAVGVYGAGIAAASLTELWPDMPNWLLFTWKGF